jgi:hypothetical protein
MHGDNTPACDIWHPVRGNHEVTGTFRVFSDGDGHYAVMGEDRKIMHYGIAHDVANMKAMELNRAA